MHGRHLRIDCIQFAGSIPKHAQRDSIVATRRVSGRAALQQQLQLRVAARTYAHELLVVGLDTLVARLKLDEASLSGERLT